MSDIQTLSEEETKETTKNIMITHPYFEAGKKHGVCPFCAALIIVDEKDQKAVCQNCLSELVLA